MLINRHERFNKCRVYKPLIAPNELHRSQINTVDFFTDTDFNQWAIAIIEVRGDRIISQVSGFSWFLTRIKSAFYPVDNFGIRYSIRPPEGLKAADYRLVIYNSTTDEVIFISNELTYEADYEETSMLATYRSSNDIRGYRYSLSIQNVIRLHINQTEPDSPSEISPYREVSTNRIQNYEYDVFRTIRFQFENYDYKAHEAVAVMLNHTEKKFDNKEFEVFSGASYEGDKDENSPTWTKSIVLEDVEFSEVTRF